MGGRHTSTERGRMSQSETKSARVSRTLRKGNGYLEATREIPEIPGNPREIPGNVKRVGNIDWSLLQAKRCL